MDEMFFKTHQEFFQKAGDGCLHPSEFGECYYPITVEEMYLHFKARMMDELADKRKVSQGLVELICSYGDARADEDIELCAERLADIIGEIQK